LKKLIVIASLLMSACSSTYVFKTKLSGELPERVIPKTIEQQPAYNDKELFRLSAEQINEFETWYNAPQYADIAPHQRLYDYLEQYTSGFDYRSDTYTASVAMTKKGGNCLSLALMTTALAKIAGVEVGYQLVNTSPVYKKKNNVLLLSYHVRTYLYDPNFEPQEGVITLVRPRLVVDYFPNRYDVPGEKVDEPRFISMYYRNLAADALMENRLSEAFWVAHRALELAPTDAENVNLMAIIYRRLDMPAVSERFYQYGMQGEHHNTNMMSNYALLLETQSRLEEAEQIRLKMLDYPDSNPYAWIKLGHEAYESGNHSRAINYYKKAMALAPYLDEIYFGMAKSLYRRGEYSKAAQAMRIAAEKSWEQSERSLYYAKLSALQARQFEPE